MATIKEMAKKYCEDSSFSDSCIEQPAYIAGANAVLKEIEDIISVGCDDVHFEEILRGKIKELKGEQV